MKGVRACVRGVSLLHKHRVMRDFSGSSMALVVTVVAVVVVVVIAGAVGCAGQSYDIDPGIVLQQSAGRDFTITACVYRTLPAVPTNGYCRLTMNAVGLGDMSRLRSSIDAVLDADDAEHNCKSWAVGYRAVVTGSCDDNPSTFFATRLHPNNTMVSSFSFSRDVLYFTRVCYQLAPDFVTRAMVVTSTGIRFSRGTASAANCFVVPNSQLPATLLAIDTLDDTLTERYVVPVGYLGLDSEAFVNGTLTGLEGTGGPPPPSPTLVGTVSESRVSPMAAIMTTAAGLVCVRLLLMRSDRVQKHQQCVWTVLVAVSLVLGLLSTHRPDDIAAAVTFLFAGWMTAMLIALMLYCVSDARRDEHAGPGVAWSGHKDPVMRIVREFVLFAGLLVTVAVLCWGV